MTGPPPAAEQPVAVKPGEDRPSPGGGEDRHMHVSVGRPQQAIRPQTVAGDVAQKIISEYDEIPANVTVLNTLTSLPADMTTAREITTGHRLAYRPDNAVSATTRQLIPYSTLSDTVAAALHAALSPNDSDGQATAALTRANAQLNALIVGSHH